MWFVNLLESPIFSLFCIFILAIALFVYLSTAVLICNSEGQKKQRKSKIKNVSKNLIPTFNCNVDNWVISTDLQQSPLNIETHRQSYRVPPLNLVNHEVIPNAMFLQNNGETLVLHASFENCIASVGGADLENQYNFVNITFRWGSNSSYGADHMLNGQTYALEMQVMYHLGPIDKELSSRKLVIISFLYEVGDFSEGLQRILRNICAVRQAGYAIKIEPFPLGAIFPLCAGGFFCYIGTMTMPPYHEGIKWFIYSKPLSLLLTQLRGFHKLLGFDMKPIEQEKRLADCLYTV